jgi:hypothetical protein
MVKLLNRYMVTKLHSVLACLLIAGAGFAADEPKPLFENNFEQSEAGTLPADFLKVDGDFAVKAVDGNKVLELPGAPLETYNVLFGPTQKAGVAVSARIKSTSQSRRTPTFALGLNGVGGFRLQVSPGKKALEIYKGDDVIATAPFEWKSGEWTMLRLQVAASGAVWKIEGKAWQGGTEPAQPTVSCEEKSEPNSGRASLWGMPYSGTPIQFDDLVVKKVAL